MFLIKNLDMLYSYLEKKDANVTIYIILKHFLSKIV